MMKTTLLSATAIATLAMAGHALAQTPPVQTPPAQPAPTAGTQAPQTVDPAAPPAAAPPANPTATTATPATPAPAVNAPLQTVVAKGDIVETLKGSGQFKTLVKALDATNLTSVLKTNPNLTLFAPTDAAFAALPAGELDRLMKNPAELQKVLTGHLVNATVDSSKIKGAKGPVNSVAGPPIQLDGSGDAITANNATVVQPDVKATNGTIHVVDKVIMPAGTPVAANMTTDMPPRIIRASYQQPTPTPDPAVPATTMPAEQQTLPSDEAPAEQVTPSAPTRPADAAAPAMTTMPDPAAQVAAATAQPTVVTNGPVLDTAENRAKYPPMSRAGKRTAAAGNR